MAPSSPSEPEAASIDAESRAWVERLVREGPERAAAVAELHELLLRAARSEVGRRGRSLRGAEREDVAQQSADDALMAVLAKLGEFRGDSRFTTWAYKFALYEASVKMRRRVWEGREIPLDPERWPLIADGTPTPAEEAQTSELLRAAQRAIESELTPHQRHVLVAVVLNDVPIDVLAERLNTTRGAIYKTLHDGRRKLRAAVFG